MSIRPRHKIAIMVPYFGSWPDWAALYFETLKKNPTIDFIFFTDCNTSVIQAQNIKFYPMSFEEYVALVNKKMDIRFAPPNAYKLCDLRPLFGHIHETVFKPYDFYGWIDMDLLLGDLRSFYTDDLLEKYDVFSTHPHRISGHFALFRNTEKNRDMYHKIYQWREALQEKEFVGIDEHGITHAYMDTFFDKINQKFKTRFPSFFSRVKKKKMYMVEQYTTPFLPRPWLDGSINSEQPGTWYYKDGVITNNRDGERNFMYLHFMNFKSSQWRHDGTKAPWENLKPICKASVEDMKEGLIIDKNGILPLSNSGKNSL